MYTLAALEQPRRYQQVPVRGETAVRRTTIPGGRAGTIATLRAMRGLAHEGARDMAVREAAIAILNRAGVRGHDFPGEVRALYNHVRDRVRFTRDIAGVETLQAPRYTLRMGFGDCDDKATALAALLGSIGHRSGIVFRAIGTSPTGYSHVYPVVRVDGRDVPMDATYTGTPLGWEHPHPALRMDLPVWPT